MKCAICYAANDAYAKLAGISIMSLYEKNMAHTDLAVYILSDEISEKNQHALYEIARRYHRTLEIIDIRPHLRRLAEGGRKAITMLLIGV